MSNIGRPEPEPESGNANKKGLEIYNFKKRFPAGGPIRVRDFARLRRSARIMARNAVNVQKTAPSAPRSDPEDLNEIWAVLQYIHFLVQVYRFLDVESVPFPCVNLCYICNDVWDGNDSMFSLTFGQLFPKTIRFFGDPNETYVYNVEIINWLSQFNEDTQQRR